MLHLDSARKFAKPMPEHLKHVPKKQYDPERFAKMYDQEKHRYDELLNRVKKIREQLKETDNPNQKANLQKTLDHLERELSGVKVNMFNIKHMMHGGEVEGGMPTGVLGKVGATLTAGKEYLSQKAIDHPVAAGIAGALAAGAGALAARKLWKRRQQKKQMMQR